MGEGRPLPLTSTPQRRAATLARALQQAQAAQLARRPASDQPRSQRLWVGQLAPRPLGNAAAENEPDLIALPERPDGVEHDAPFDVATRHVGQQHRYPEVVPAHDGMRLVLG